eukprot:12637011-Ditylum_brightwellii.AAC.1
MGVWLKAHADELPADFPVELIMKAFKLVMKSNFFIWRHMVVTDTRSGNGHAMCIHHCHAILWTI